MLPESFVASPDVILAETLQDGTGVLLHVRTKFYYVLNETGVFAWKALAEERARTVEAIASAIHAEFEVELDTARTDLARMFTDLFDEGLVAA